MASSLPADEPIPLPSEQPPEVDYLQTRHGEYQNAPLAYDNRSRQFVPQPFRTRTISWDVDPPQDVGALLAERTDRFTGAVEKLKRKKSKESEIAKFEFRDAESWEDVVKSVQAVEERYSATDSVSGKFRRFFRKIGENGKSLQSFVGLLPDGNYKTLCGGLTLILTAMVRHTEIREKMSELMDELPDDIVDIEEYVEIYGGSKLLRELAEQLYVDILLALEYCVEWYTQSSRKHVIDSLLKNTDYSQQIDNQLHSISRSRTRLEKTRTRFLHKRFKVMHATVLETHGTVLETHEVVKDSHDGLRKLEHSLNDAKIGAQEASHTLMRQMSLQSQTLNGIQNILSDQTRNAKWRRDIEGVVDALKKHNRILAEENAELRNRVNETSYKPKSLARLLGLSLPDDGYLSDVNTVHVRGLAESLDFQYRAKWTAQNAQFLSWLDSSRSEMILIQAHSIFEPVSPASLLISLLSQRLIEEHDVLVLPLFCGLHTGNRLDKTRREDGPVLLIRALLAQLLSIKTLDWTKGIDGFPLLSLKAGVESKLVENSFSAYLKLICNVIALLRSKYQAIFILIDGLDWYDLTWEKETRRLVASFLRMVGSQDEVQTAECGVLKVLFSAATHSDQWLRAVERAVLLDIPDEIDGDGDIFDKLDLST